MLVVMAAIKGDQSERFDVKNKDDKDSFDRDDNNATARMSRKEKRRLLKKEKRKLARREAAKQEREEGEARLNDPEEQLKLKMMELEEAERMERDRLEFEERERQFLEALEQKKKREEEEEKEREQEERKKLLEEKQVENENPKEAEEGSDCEYVEEGPAEIIWQGNEIIVRKKKVRVPKKLEQQKNKEDIDRPISNPLAPECEVFEDYKSAQELLESVAQQVPNFGTEQDKAHCPFHLKTGACRFGTHCSRVHFYPDKSCTLLMKNMYSGPGLSWEQDEGLEYTEEEIERCFEDFYEDVHTEFLKFGEIVNFKVCRNGSSHLRGNVYVHYKCLESAMLAYHSINGRYFAGKQVTCEFVNVTKWKVAICGEFMKSRLRTCSRGSICNFIHCFRNPGGDYEWADFDKPPPRHWVKKMASLFGYKDGYDKQLDSLSPSQNRSDSKMVSGDAESYYLRRSRSRDLESRRGRSHYDDDWNTRRRRPRHESHGKENSSDRDMDEERNQFKENRHLRRRNYEIYSDDDQFDGIQKREGYYTHKRRRHRRSGSGRGSIGLESNSDKDFSVHYECRTIKSRHNKTGYRDDGSDSDSSSSGSYKDETRKGEERYTRSKRKSPRWRDNKLEYSNSDLAGGKDPEYRSHIKQSRQWLEHSNSEFRERFNRDNEEGYSSCKIRSLKPKSKKSDFTEIDSHWQDDHCRRDKSRKRERDADVKSKRSNTYERRTSGHRSRDLRNDGSARAYGQDFHTHSNTERFNEEGREDSCRDISGERNCEKVSRRLDEAEPDFSYEDDGNKGGSYLDRKENVESSELQKLEAGSECLSIKACPPVDLGIEEEMAYRRAALEKLEEKKRLKAKLHLRNSGNIVSLESSHDNAPEGQMAEKVNVGSRKRLRI